MNIFCTGGHTPRGRVTALPSTTASQPVGSGPAIATPQYVFGSMINGQFVPGLPQQAPIATTNGPPVPPPIIGYSGAHAHHAQQTQKWSQLAYRGNGGGGASNIINVNLEIYQPEMDKKGEPVRIPVCFLVKLVSCILLTEYSPGDKRVCYCVSRYLPPRSLPCNQR